MRTPIGAVLAILAILPLAAPAVAGWEEDLTRQMMEDEHCEVAFIANVVERQLPDGRTAIKAHVHCYDQRAFDAAREGELRRFKIERCKEERAC